jgi:sirohydrochlorin cobaltochelatase
MDALAERFAQKMQHAGLEKLSMSGAGSAIAAEQSSQATVFPRATTVITADVARPLASTACLECNPLPLHRQIEQFSAVAQSTLATNSASQANRCRLVLLPLFLLPGVHVMEDIPKEIALARQALGDEIAIELRPAIGAHPGLHRLVTECMAAQPVEAWILLSHGSRRANGNHPVAALAERLGALTAYWSVAPSLESRLQELSQLGLRNVGILPYFLFAGGITDAIAQTVETLSQQFPTLKLHLAEPLAASSELTDLLVDLAQDRGKG